MSAQTATLSSIQGVNNSGQSPEDTSRQVAYKESRKYPLSQVMFAAIFDIHTKAQHHAFTAAFLRSQVPMHLHASFLLMLYHIYNTLEEELTDERFDPSLREHVFGRELFRRQNLKADLEFYLGKVFANDLVMKEPSPTVREYCNVLRQAARGPNPEALIAHAYVRYLGDLSGGQLFAKSVRRAYNLKEDGDNGVAFVAFENIVDTEGFKNVYRDSLNKLGKTADHQVMVDACVEGFEWNLLIFDELYAEFDMWKRGEKGTPIVMLKPHLKQGRVSWHDMMERSLDPPSGYSKIPKVTKSLVDNQFANMVVGTALVALFATQFLIHSNRR